MRRTVGILTLAAIGFIATAPTALAIKPPPVVRQSTVDYGDLNLSTHHGDRALISRISRAATKDCGGVPTGAQLDGYLRFDKCKAAAEQGAIKQVHNAAVAQLFDKETGAKL